MRDGGHQWDFFIAHAGDDEEAAETLYEHLHAARTFLDTKCLKLGDDWDAELSAAQRAALVTVVLVSSRTERAYYQREEIAAAIALARKDADAHRVVPIYLDLEAEKSDHTPYGLRLKHGLQLSDRLDLAAAAGKLLELLDDVRSGSGGARSASAPPAPPGLIHQPPPDWESPVRRNPWRYKVVAFDLDGTLVRGAAFEFSWELVWNALGFSEEIQGDLKREYRRRSAGAANDRARIDAYTRWCQEAVDCFKTRGLTRDQLRQLAGPLTLTRNCRQALAKLRQEGVVTAIISGGIDTFLEDKFPDFRDHVDFAFINQLVFADDGRLEGVRATAFDFQGKAAALTLVGERAGSTPTEAVFVGDHFNDEAVMLHVDRAIAYPAQDVVTRNASHVEVPEDDLEKILPHILEK